MSSTKKPPPLVPPTLTLHAFKLTNPDAEILENLAKDLSDRTGRAASRSAALRALIRVSEAFDGPLLERLADAMAKEFQMGVRWGKDSTKAAVEAELRQGRYWGDDQIGQRPRG